MKKRRLRECLPTARIIGLKLLVFGGLWNLISGGCTVGTESFKCPATSSRLCRCNISSEEVQIVCLYRYYGCSHGGVEPFLQVPSPLPQRLTLIDLNSNNVTTIGRDSFRGCTHLRSLLLRNNLIATIEVGAFSDLTNLEELHLHLNELRLYDGGSFPIGVLDPLTALRVLKLDTNRLGNLTEYRADVFRNKPKLSFVSLDAVPRAKLPRVGGDIRLDALRAIELYDAGPVLAHQFDDWDDVTVEVLGAHTRNFNARSLTSVDPQVFEHLPRLKQLDLSWNPGLSLKGSVLRVVEALRGSKVERLVFTYIGNGTTDVDNLPAAFLDSLKRMNLTELSLEGTGLGNLQPQDDMSSYLPKLQVLSLAYNRLFDNVLGIINRTENMSELRLINMNKQARVFVKPEATDEATGRLGEPARSSTRLNLAPNVNELHLSDAFGYASFAIRGLTIWGGSANFSLIDLSRNTFWKLTGPILFHSPLHPSRRIDRLNLSDCSIEYICGRLFPTTVSNLTIVSLDLSRNYKLGRFLSADSEGRILASLNNTGVRVLNISATYTTFLHTNFFRYLTTLSELVMRDNELGSWPEGINLLSGLQRLDLSWNKLLFLPPSATEFISERARDRGSFELDLSSNPFLEDCHSLPFLRWLHGLPKDVSLVNKEHTIFFTGAQSNFSELGRIIRFLDANCKSETWIKVAGGMAGFVLLAMYVAVLVHRNRWAIKYFFVELSRRRKGYAALKGRRGSLVYDAFVAYHADSLRWLVEEMLEHLEGRYAAEPLKLCLHHRDWLPGIPIEENVLASIKASRRTVVLLTRSFLRSNWCDFELQMARIHGFDEGHDVLVVVQLEEIPINEMNRTLLNLWKTHTWLELPTSDDPEAMEDFWERLRRALKRSKRKPAVCACGRIIDPECRYNETGST